MIGAASMFLRPSAPGNDFELGLQMLRQGKPQRAAELFSAAISQNSSRKAPRFELGRARIALGEIDLALNEFNRLARENNDAESMAYLGYCFNLKRIPAAAIPWYERAVRGGAASAAVFNNLAASYLDGSTNLSRNEQLRLAEKYLNQAIQTDVVSQPVQINILRQAVMKSKLDPSYDPFQVWPHARSLLSAARTDRFVESHIAVWYGTVVEREQSLTGPPAGQRAVQAVAVSSAREAFTAIYQKLASVHQGEGFGDKTSRERLNYYFLEPLSLEAEKPSA
jgi:tetratricopeptide (TPR) repeat protein